MCLTIRRNNETRPFPFSLATVLACALVLSATLACAPGEEEMAEPGETAAGEEAPAGERVENGGVGIALTAVPAGFEVETNEGEELVLVRTGEEGGRLAFEMTPVQAAGVNLQQMVWAEKERIEGLPNGQYRGQNELGGVPLGTTYTSRGRFETEEGESVEEYRALMVHPTQNRALILDYEYPTPAPGSEEGSSRLEHLMLVLEQVEPLAASEADAPDAENAPMGEPMEQTPGDVEDAMEGGGESGEGGEAAAEGEGG